MGVSDLTLIDSSIKQHKQPAAAADFTLLKLLFSGLLKICPNSDWYEEKLDVSLFQHAAHLKANRGNTTVQESVNQNVQHCSLFDS